MAVDKEVGELRVSEKASHRNAGKDSAEW